MDRRTNTWSFFKTNPGVSLKGEVPPKGRNDWIAKRNEFRILESHKKPRENTFSEKESSYRSSKSTTKISNGNFYDTPKVIGHEKLMPQDPFGVGQRETNDLFRTSHFPTFSIFLQRRPSHEDILVTDVTSSFEDVIQDLDELNVLRR